MAIRKKLFLILKKIPLFTAGILFFLVFTLPNLVIAQTGSVQIALESFNKGKDAFLIGNYTKAIDFFDEAIKFQSNLKEVNYQAGLAAYNLKDYAKAIGYFTAEIKNNNQNIKSYLYR